MVNVFIHVDLEVNGHPECYCTLYGGQIYVFKDMAVRTSSMFTPTLMPTVGLLSSVIILPWYITVGGVINACHRFALRQDRLRSSFDSSRRYSPSPFILLATLPIDHDDILGAFYVKVDDDEGTVYVFESRVAAIVEQWVEVCRKARKDDSSTSAEIISYVCYLRYISIICLVFGWMIYYDQLRSIDRLEAASEEADDF